MCKKFEVFQFCVTFTSYYAYFGTIYVVNVFCLYEDLPPFSHYHKGFWVNIVGLTWTMLYMASVDYVLKKHIRSLRLNFYLVIGIILVLSFSAWSTWLWLTGVERDDMIEYSANYFKKYKKIPIFLDKFQHEYLCCGINNYNDYKNKDLFFIREGQIKINKTVNKNHKDWEIYKNDKSLDREYSVYVSTFSVPRSCCSVQAHDTDVSCGDNILYNRPEDEFEEPYSPKYILNSMEEEGGCFERFHHVIHTEAYYYSWNIWPLQYFNCVLIFLSVVIIYFLWKVIIRNMVYMWVAELPYRYDEESSSSSNSISPSNIENDSVDINPSDASAKQYPPPVNDSSTMNPVKDSSIEVATSSRLTIKKPQIPGNTNDTSLQTSAVSFAPSVANESIVTVPPQSIVTIDPSKLPDKD